MDTFSQEALDNMKRFFSAIKNFFGGIFGNREKFKQVFDTTFDLAADSLPFIDMAATLVTGVTPTNIDNIALAAIKTKYPRLFDGSIKTGEELKLYTLGVATELVKAKHPQATTSEARLAVQTAFVAAKIDKETN